MKRKLSGLDRVFLSVILIVPVLGRAADWRPLWNGRDFEGWQRFLGQPHPTVVLPATPGGRPLPRHEPLGVENDPLGVFTVGPENGAPAIRISGQIFGSISTRQEYSNYHLRLQIKWGPAKWPPRDKWELRDSGLLYHAHTPMNHEGRLWPRSLEFQIMEQNLGDFYAVGARISARASPESGPDGRPLFRYDPAGDLIAFAREGPGGGRCIRGPVTERPFGEWNTLELVCHGAEAIHIVNGRVVLRLKDATRVDRDPPVPLTAGRIHIISEGAELFVRSIEIRQIADVPPEFQSR